jgi:hypothetical protein
MKKLVALLAIALVAVGAGTIYLWRQLDAERTVNTDLQARMKALETMQQSFAAAFAARAQSATGTTDPQAAAGPADPARQAAARRPVEALISRARENLATPQGQQAVTGMVRAMLPRALPDLAKELNLSPAEAEKFMELLARQQNTQISQLAGGGSVQEMVANAERIRQANEAEIAAQLGGKYPQWQEYQANLPMRQQVNQLQTTLSATGNQLSDSQTRPLIAALSAEQKRITEETRNVPATPGATPQERRDQRQQRTAESNRRMVEAASPYMNTQQLDAYKTSLGRQNSIQGLQGLLGGGQRGAAAQAPAR